jgi:hypothetical protein
MNTPPRRVFLAEEAKTGLALLQAAEEEGLLRTPALAARWEEIRDRLRGDDPAPRDRLAIFELLRELAATPGCERHWIRQRWARIDRAEKM